jgi:N-acetylmuramoyl-L-alanine amidase
LYICAIKNNKSKKIIGSKMKKFSLLLVLSIGILFVGCSKESDKSYFDEAQKMMDAENYYEALINFQKIVDDFPNSAHYKFSLLQVGELNQGYVDKNLSKNVSLLKAIKAYSEYSEKYPDDEKAPQTLFMIGFIQANELGKIDEAKATYQKFLEKYPESVMAESAKAEIENLGLTPDQILLQKTQK